MATKQVNQTYQQDELDLGLDIAQIAIHVPAEDPWQPTTPDEMDLAVLNPSFYNSLEFSA